MDAKHAGSSETYCPHCGHLYASEALECPRCPMAAGHVKGGRCPACGKPLVLEKMGDVTVDRCTACGGLWFDRGEVVRVLDMHTVASGATLTELERRFPSHRAQERHKSRACVRCRTRMHRLPAAPRAPVYVDLCGPHGVWFEGGDFEKFREFVAAGGLEVARALEEAHPKHPPGAALPQQTSFYLYPGWPPESLTLLQLIHHVAGPTPQPRGWGQVGQLPK